MIGLFIGVFATLTLAQFAISWWRAMVAQVAEHPISMRGRVLTEQWDQRHDALDFKALISLNESCPFAARFCELGFVCLYFKLLEKFRGAVANFSPALAQWAEGEMELCFRYAAVRTDERLARAHALMAEMRTF